MCLIQHNGGNRLEINLLLRGVFNSKKNTSREIVNLPATEHSNVNLATETLNDTFMCYVG